MSMTSGSRVGTRVGSASSYCATGKNGGGRLKEKPSGSLERCNIREGRALTLRGGVRFDTLVGNILEGKSLEWLCGHSGAECTSLPSRPTDLTPRLCPRVGRVSQECSQLISHLLLPPTSLVGSGG